jgi:2,5-dihydroxypyridine 5,6-dioxygenase
LGRHYIRAGNIRGQVKVQLGSNDDVAFGGAIRSRAHLGLCLRGASLFLAGQPVIKDGTLI